MIKAMTSALAGEREFAGFGDPEQLCGFGAATGACREKPATKPSPSSASVKRVQMALRGLTLRVKDPATVVDADGLIGPKTVKATNYALQRYTNGPAPINSGKLTKAQIVSMAPQIAAALERAPERIAASSTIAFQPIPAAPNLPAPPRPAYTPSSGGSSMPYPPQAQYYPPGYAPAPMYPGYAPPQEASVDTKIFIPAQYERIKFNPMTVALVLAVGVGTVFIVNKKAQYKYIGKP